MKTRLCESCHAAMFASVHRHANALDDGWGTENVEGINIEADGPSDNASVSWSRRTHRSTRGWNGEEKRWFAADHRTFISVAV
jgi:hypothetical protein